MRGLGAAILVYEPDGRLVNAVDALLAADVTPQRVVIVNNGDDTPALAAVRRRHPFIGVVHLPDNPGYGGGMNAAAARLLDQGCEMLLFITQETRLEPTAVRQLCDALMKDSSLAVVGPTLVRLTDSDIVWSTGGRLTRWRRRPVHEGSGQSVKAARPAATRKCEWVDGACMLIRASDFVSIHGFRPDLFLYWEDVDICLRLRRRERSVATVGSAWAAQEPSMTPPYLDSRNKALVLGWPGRGGVLIDVALRGAADLVRGHGLRRSRLMIQGLRDGTRRVTVLDRARALERP